MGDGESSDEEEVAAPATQAEPAPPGHGFWWCIWLLVLYGISDGLARLIDRGVHALAAATRLPGGLAVDAVAAVVGLAAFIPLLRWGARVAGLRAGAAYSLAWPGLAAVTAVLVMQVGLSIVVSSANHLLAPLLPPVPAWAERMVLERGLAGVAMAAPIIEELVFRGLLLGGLLLRHRARTAIWLSTALFVLVHLPPWQVPASLACGFAFGWIAARSRTLVLTILAHSLNNGWAVLRVEGALPKLTVDGAVAPATWVLGLVLLAAGLRWLDRVLPRRETVDSAAAAAPVP